MLWPAYVLATGLQWEANRRELTALAGDQEAVAWFPFKNTSASPVTITHLMTSCDCTTATASPTVVEPGESGVIRAVLKIGDRIGQQEKTIAVTTDNDANQPAHLVLHVTIREIVICNPRLVQWTTGDLLEEKVIRVSAVSPFKLRSVTSAADTSDFWCTIEKQPESDAFLLKIKPAANAARSRRVLQMSADVEGRPPLAFAVYAIIQPAEPQ